MGLSVGWSGQAFLREDILWRPGGPGEVVSKGRRALGAKGRVCVKAQETASNQDTSAGWQVGSCDPGRLWRDGADPELRRQKKQWGLGPQGPQEPHGEN